MKHLQEFVRVEGEKMISGIRQALVWVLAAGTLARLGATLTFRATLYKMKAAIPVSEERGVRGGSTL